MSIHRHSRIVLAAAAIVLNCLGLIADANGETHWVSPSGTASWPSCRGSKPLSGTAACSVSTANTNAKAGDTVYFREGTYSFSRKYGLAVAPANSGVCSKAPCAGGTGAAFLTFAAYPGETPVLKQINVSDTMVALALFGNSWVRVTGLTFQNFNGYYAFLKGGANHNEISYNSFVSGSGYQAGTGFIVGDYSGPPWSTHNWIHHNYISSRQSRNPCGEAIDLVRLGNAENNPYAADNYNTFEYNYVEYGGHSTVTTNAKYEVVRGNVAHNEPFISGCINWQTSTSTSRLTIAKGSRSLSTQAGLSWKSGQPISIVANSDYAQAMLGRVVSYDRSTGNLVANIIATTGSGIHASWVLSASNIPQYTNSSYNLMFGHRNFQIGNSDIDHPGYVLVEGNRAGFASVNPGNGGSMGMDIDSPRNIVRYNAIYGGMQSGIYLKYANAHGVATGGAFNYLYNNTLFYNGYGWNSAVYGAMNVTYNGQGIAQFTYGGRTANQIKNNIVYKNGQGDICFLGLYGGNNCTASNIDTVANNWLTSSGNPGFTNPDLSNPLSQNLLPWVHGYISGVPLPDLRLRSDSGARDGGTYLTTAKGSGSLSTTLVVEDAGYFQDGTWGAELARGVTFFSDWISIGEVTNTAQIRSIDYSTNVITLAAPVSWRNGAPVWLYRKSDGALVLSGKAPDYGAHEYSEPASTSEVQNSLKH